MTMKPAQVRTAQDQGSFRMNEADSSGAGPVSVCDEKCFSRAETVVRNVAKTRGGRRGY